MKILVISDTHGEQDILLDVFLKHRNEIDVLIHLGDCATDLKILKGHTTSELMIFSVAGNMDGAYRDKASLEQLVTLEDKNVLITHSDHLKTHFGLQQLYFRACELDADLCLFGHTHQPYFHPEKPVMFNPGALCRDSRGSTSGYGIVDLSDGKINCNRFQV